MARNYTTGERSLIILGMMAGKTCEELNLLLTKDQEKLGASKREVPLGTYSMIKERYFPALGIPQDSPHWIFEVFDHTVHPRSAKDLCTLSQLELGSADNDQLKLFGDVNV